MPKAPWTKNRTERLNSFLDERNECATELKKAEARGDKQAADFYRGALNDVDRVLREC